MKLKHKTYNYRYAKKIADIVPETFVESLKLDPKKLKKGCNEKIKRNKYIRGVFFDFLRILIDDCIENNHKFISPNKEYFAIYIREKRPGDRKRILNKISKIYIDMDILGSNGKIYEFVLYSKFLSPKWYRNIRIGHHKYRELMLKVNKGKRYFMK